MEFCPSCGLLLQFELGNINRFRCPVCPYVSLMESKVKIKKKQRLVKKAIDPILSDNDLITADVVSEPCPVCHHEKSYVKQVQTRSADEGSTNYHMCAKDGCRNRWNIAS